MPADAPPLGSTAAIGTSAPRPGLSAVAPTPAPPLWSGVEIESAALLKAALPAHRALAACAQALATTSLDTGALAALSVLDAVGAVQLDGVPVDPREQLEAPPGQREPAVLRQLDALEHALVAPERTPVGSTLALELAARIAGRGVAVRRRAIDPREGGVAPPAGARRAPPPLPQGAERLQLRLDRWQDFVQRDSGDLDPLLMSGTALAEWLSIRPFTSVNVPLGQLLVQLLLIEEDLLPLAALPLSLHASRHSEACWRALHESRVARHPEAWLRFFLGAVEASARDTVARLAAWERLLGELPATLEHLLPKTPSRALVQLCARPSFGLADAIDTGLQRRQTAAAWLARLVDGGLLREVRAGKEKRFVNDAVTSLLLD